MWELEEPEVPGKCLVGVDDVLTVMRDLLNCAWERMLVMTLCLDRAKLVEPTNLKSPSERILPRGYWTSYLIS